MSEFRNCLIGDIAEIIGGGTPSTKNPENFGGDISWITPKDLSDHDEMYISRGARSITKTGLENCSAKLLPANSILFTSRAPIGYVALAKKEISTNQGFKSLVLKDDNDPKFFYYLLKNITPKIKSYASGSVFQEISGKVLSTIPIKIPDTNSQKRIGEFLEKFDKKIELNQKNNVTLEDLSKTLFKSWFIDFNPVRAKAEGNSTGLPDQISSLFPDSFEDSKLGKIPNGWKIINLDKITSKFTTGLNPRKNFILGSGNNFYVTIKNLGNLQVLLNDKCDKVDDQAIKKINDRSDLQINDILFSAIGTIGKVSYVYDDPNNWNISESLFSLRANNQLISASFLYQLLKSHNLQSYAVALASGSVQKGIRMRDLKNYELVLSSNHIQKIFEKITFPIIQKISFNLKENNTLESLRQLLLPKVISGELKISDAEKFLERIVI